MHDLPLEAIDPGVMPGALRALADLLRRAADALERPGARRLALEPLGVAPDADEAMLERRHQLFTRYY